MRAHLRQRQVKVRRRAAGETGTLTARAAKKESPAGAREEAEGTRMQEEADVLSGMQIRSGREAAERRRPARNVLPGASGREAVRADAGQTARAVLRRRVRIRAEGRNASAGRANVPARVRGAQPVREDRRARKIVRKKGQTAGRCFRRA